MLTDDLSKLCTSIMCGRRSSGCCRKKSDGDEVGGGVA